MTILELARRFAAALDAEDYEAARATLAPNCVYHARECTLIGPEAIVSSYRESAVAGRVRFEKVEFRSVVASTSSSGALITFFDRVMLGGAWHQFSCSQRIGIGSPGLIEEIWHEEISGQREQLQQFEAMRRPLG